MMNATPVLAPGAASKAALSGTVNEAMDALHALQQLASQDPSFAQALKQTGSTHAAASLARRHGLQVSAESLWRNRGRNGLPTWRG
jgi:alkylated DNA repair dioxygenase AlkB